LSTAAVASERVLKKRAAHSHLSMRTDSMPSFYPSHRRRQARAGLSNCRLIR
jgi:hypothetical protein